MTGSFRERDVTEVMARRRTTGLTLRRRAKLVMLGGATPGRIYLLRQAGVSQIGRDPSSDVTLEESDVSRTHACIESQGDHRYTIEDCGSRNGTQLNGVPLSAVEPLAYGDMIHFGGRTTCVFTHHDPADEQLARLRRLDALGQLAAGLSHDFGNVLHVLASCLEALEETTDAQEVVAIRQDMREAVDKGRTLTRQMLDFARRETPELVRMDLRRPVGEAVALFQRTLDRVPIAVETRLQSATVAIDAKALQQALLNLLINARDAMPEGGRLEVRSLVREVSDGDAHLLLTAGRYALLSVSDSGVGMDDETRERIFEPFFTTKPVGKGTGLGLASVFGIVRAHGGQVGVRSVLGQGTTFDIYLPLCAEDGEPAGTWLLKKVPSQG